MWAAVIAAVSAEAVGWSSPAARPRSGGRGERADRVEGGDVVAVPGPAGGQVQRPPARVTGESARDGEQAAAKGAGGTDGRVWQAELLGPAQQVVRERAEHGPGAVGVKVARREVCQRLVFEIGDDLLDDGMVAVFGFDEGEIVGAVGQDREVAPVGEQLGLRAEQASAPDDQPPLA